jgi:galactokinase/mevalonate kinase-like predicted kinase
LSDVGATLEDVWDSKIPQAERSVWNARLFPAEKISTDYRRWLWMYRPEESTSQHRQDWLGSDRYSLAEVAAMSDHVEFHRLRVELHTRHLYQDVEAVFLINNSYSAEDLAIALENYSDPDEILNALLETLFARGGSNAEKTTVDFFLNSRVLHTLSSAMKNVANNPTDPVSSLFPNIASNLNPKYLEQLNALGVLFESDAQVQVVSDQLRRAAFSEIRKTIQGPPVVLDFPRRCLKNNETVWGRAPCRLDLAGGWTDTPPYSLNHGGVVLNAAINLDGETPVQVFVKPLEEPLFRLVSVDQGTTIEIQDYQELRSPQSLLTEFTLVTQALIQTGLAPNELSEKTPGTLRERIERFGGGLEITTRSTVPKGSGLGTSSILGAVVLAALHRTMGKTLSQRELFYETLRLEQALTSGGGWQDQVGGIVEEVKLISADPGLVPEFRIQQVQQELLDPRLNNNRTLLYYTGINRLAKDILEKVVGRYLDRDRVVMATLSNLHQLSIRLADVMNGMDYEQFGKMVSHAWQLNKHLDQSSTNTDVEKIMSLIQPYVYGAKLLGAGGGGFVLMVCRSEKHAKNVYQLLTDNPPNNQARFYGFEINSEGMVVSVV